MFLEALVSINSLLTRQRSTLQAIMIASTTRGLVQKSIIAADSILEKVMSSSSLLFTGAGYGLFK